MLLQSELARDPEADPQAASQKVRSLHPMLGWICCISVVGANPDGSLRTPVSFTAAGPDEEEALLRAFWDRVGRLERYRVTWVTFNGKAFDAEFLRTRSLVWELIPPRLDLFDDYLYGFHPHCDLKCLWRRSAVRLEDVCDLLGVPSPKQEMNGDGVCAALQAGDLDAVRRYCEADAVATLRCFQRLRPVIPFRRQPSPA
ncbi:MAG: exonuclease [Bacteroidetes bacterium]|nr:MAG: exonuclease [Bacteroidota bacterium]